MYWVDSRSNKATIKKSSLTGSNEEIILSSLELQSPRSLIVKGKFLYWMDRITKRRRGGFKLEKYNINTKLKETVCSSHNMTMQPFAMDISDKGDFVYVSDWHNMVVWKLKLNTTDDKRYRIILLE